VTIPVLDMAPKEFEDRSTTLVQDYMTDHRNVTVQVTIVPRTYPFILQITLESVWYLETQ
jgi:hypothetical protein